MSRVFVLAALCCLTACNQSAPAHLARAHDADFEKKPDEALREYRLALDALAQDTSAEAQVLRARALRGAADIYYLELRDMKHAVEVYRELISVCPEAPETLEGRVHLSNLLRTHFRDLRGAINELTAAIARNPPESAELSYQVAKLYFELGDYQQCELESKGLTKKYETSAFVDDALLLRAQALAMMEGRRPDAIRAFQELADTFPESDLQPHALFELGKLRAEGGEPERAIEVWVQALKRHPDPAVVQSSITMVRNRMVAGSPRKIGEVGAFDRDLRGQKTVRAPKTSLEAMGASADEVEREPGSGGAKAKPIGLKAKGEESSPPSRAGD